MKQIAGLIGLAFLPLLVGCSSTAPTEKRQPTVVADFKTVAGKWEGRLTSDDPRALHYDRAIVVIDDSGACELAVTRTRTKVEGMSVSYDTIDVFAEKAQLTLTGDKLTAKFENGGHMTAQLYVDPASGERVVTAEGRNSHGFTYSADLRRTAEPVSAK